MNFSSYIELLQSAIKLQKTALRFHLILACGVIFLGLIVISIVHLFSGTLIPQNLKWLITIGGTFFSTLSSFPVKEIFSRKNRIAALNFLINEFKRIESQDVRKDADIKHLEDRFWRFVDASLGA